MNWQELKAQILLQYENDMIERRKQIIERDKGWIGLDFSEQPSFYTWFCNLELESK